MGTYVTSRCGNCNNIIKRERNTFYYVTTIGNPFSQCPYCHNIIVDKHIKEHTMLKKYDYFKMHIPDFWGSIGLSIIISVCTSLILENKNTLFFVVETIIVFIPIFLLIFKKTKKNIKMDIEKSKERLCNYEYREMIKYIMSDDFKNSN